MKRFLLLIVLFFVFVVVNSQTVYITKTGKKYHKKTCNYLKYSKKAVPLKRTLYFGYLPCKVCTPVKNKEKSKEIKKMNSFFNSQKKGIVVQCTGKTKSGRRCKRRTRNDSKRCYQH